jgi:Fibronectin type III domain
MNMKIPGIQSAAFPLVLVFILFGSISNAQTTRSVSLAWDASASSAVIGYNVAYGTSATDLSQVVNVGNNLTATISNLSDSQTYFFVVTDYTGTGATSVPSNMVVLIPSTGTSGSGPSSQSSVTASASILWQNASTGGVGIWQMAGTSILATQMLGQIDPRWVIAGVGDFAGTGNNEILWYNAQLGLVGIWTMNGATPTGSYVLNGGSPDWEIAAVADFDHTGFSDIVWRQKSTGAVYLWKWVAPVAFNSIFIASVDPSWQISGAADVEGSGSPDLIWRNTNTGALAIWQLISDQPGQQVQMGNFSLDFAIAGFGDFNGAGKADILWRNQTTGDVYVWLMNGFTVAGEWYSGSIDPSWRIVGTPNLETSGTISDVLWINTASGSVAAWLGSPSGFTHIAPFASVPSGWLPVPALNY